MCRHSKYGYDVCPSKKICDKFVHKKYWTQYDIMNFIEEINTLLNDKNRPYDSLIVNISCHGKEGKKGNCIIASDGLGYTIT